MDTESMLSDNALRQFDGLATSPDGKDYTCPACGYMPAKLVRFAGKERYVTPLCPCRRAERDALDLAEINRERMMHLARRTYGWLGERWSDSALMQKTFENFNLLAQPEAHEDVKAYVDIFRGTLVLHGGYGTGKTHLLAALCNQVLRDRRKSSLFVTAPKLFAAIQARIQAQEDYSSIIIAAIKTDLFVLDDVDKAKRTDFREEVYFEIINERVNAGRPIALSTNRLADLASFVGGAVESRLRVGQIAIEMTGADYRKGMEA